ncbi:MAG: HIRAN domain-containing protein [Coriobacteriia bacterium]|nr:HIRAN domain-containing protein [Coriobacteriia bacterium]
MDFCIAGFTYWDGAFVLQKMQVGDKLDLQPEEDNPYDPKAVALCYQGIKVGYVPREKNAQISQLLFFGQNPFEAVIAQIDPEAHPERQVRVIIRVKDAYNRS